MSREDIESLNWVYHENSGIYFWNNEQKYRLMHVPSMFYKTRIWTETSNVGFSDTIFEGSIRDKEELVVLMRQLEIRKDTNGKGIEETEV
jgi:hypothetical protein